MSVQLPSSFFRCTRNPDLLEAKNKYGKEGIYSLYQTICTTIPPELRETTLFTGEKVIVPVPEAVNTNAWVQRINKINCKSETTQFTGLLAFAQQFDKQVIVRFHPCVQESER